MPTKRSKFLCVVPAGELATTAKTLRTLALGKLVVTEDWVTASKEEGQLLEPDDFVHEALEDTINKNRSKLFKGKILYFTTKLKASYGKEGWESIQALCREAGANLVQSGSASNGDKTASLSNIIFFGSAEDDPDVNELISKHGYEVYHKDMLMQGVLRGEVDLKDDEYKLKATASSTAMKRGRR